VFFLGTRRGSKEGKNRLYAVFSFSFTLRLCRPARSCELGHIFKKLRWKQKNYITTKNPNQESIIFLLSFDCFFFLSFLLLEALVPVDHSPPSILSPPKI